MDLIKHYINQSITIAANNLRLNNQQIEVVALLKQTISKSEYLSDDLINMKKITELSLLAIRLNEIYNSLTQNPIDLLKISDQFKEHSRYLIKDLGHMLDITTPDVFKKAIEKLNGAIVFPKEEIKIDLSKRIPDEEMFTKSDTEEIKEKIIFSEDFDNEDDDIFNFDQHKKSIKLLKLSGAKYTIHERKTRRSQCLLRIQEIMEDHRLELMPHQCYLLKI